MFEAPARLGPDFMFVSVFIVRSKDELFCGLIAATLRSWHGWKELVVLAEIVRISDAALEDIVARDSVSFDLTEFFNEHTECFGVFWLGFG